MCQWAVAALFQASLLSSKALTEASGWWAASQRPVQSCCSPFRLGGSSRHPACRLFLMAQQVTALLGCCALMFWQALSVRRHLKADEQQPVMLPFRMHPKGACNEFQSLAAGGVEEGTITFEPCATLVDHWVVVSEAEIAAAMVKVQAEHAVRIEGGLLN